MLQAKVFRSTRPSARIKRLDVSKARALPGVACVLTAEDVPHNEEIKNVVGQTTEVGLLEAKHQVLARQRVRFYGEPIALVAAESPETAEEAMGLIEVEYEELPAVFDPLEAMKPAAPKVHGNNNVIAHWQLRKGDVEEGFRQADVIVENTYRTPRQEHAHLEPESGVSWLDDMRVINIRSASQVIEHYRDVAAVLGIPESRVRIIGTLSGGGSGKGPFGAKGIGEPGITAAAQAVMNSIRDAIGIRITHIPAAPERVYWALREAEGKR